MRGFLAGTVRKKLKLQLQSQKVDGRRTYRIKSGKVCRQRLASRGQFNPMAIRSDQRKTLEAEIRRLPDLDLTSSGTAGKLSSATRHPSPCAANSWRGPSHIRCRSRPMAAFRIRRSGGSARSPEAVRRGNPDAAGLARQIRPGTQMIRQWRDETHIVTAISQGFEWNGQTYKSLSAVAKEITGTNWNGYAFFGIKRASIANKNAAGPHQMSGKERASPDVRPASDTVKANRSRSRASSVTKQIRRCAIYTRKSSEEGLEQDFNSLHAQRESCEAYINSQKHEGWIALPAIYDDGGYSGGSMDRPALKQLLADIKSGSVDVVVVYKVDRLTRSLSDFARIVEVFDVAGASFVSVTQQFNTTTSMGRLTLNVLLSFAQFEREVTGERIRDKIAASKKKGMWMGGWVPLGFDRKDRTLAINKTEAKTVRTIFELFLKLKNVRDGTEGARSTQSQDQSIFGPAGPYRRQSFLRPRTYLQDPLQSALPG